jgi:hypothetical protein
VEDVRLRFRLEEEVEVAVEGFLRLFDDLEVDVEELSVVDRDVRRLCKKKEI